MFHEYEKYIIVEYYLPIRAEGGGGFASGSVAAGIVLVQLANDEINVEAGGRESISSYFCCCWIVQKEKEKIDQVIRDFELDKDICKDHENAPKMRKLSEYRISNQPSDFS